MVQVMNMFPGCLLELRLGINAELALHCRGLFVRKQPVKLVEAGTLKGD